VLSAATLCAPEPAAAAGVPQGFVGMVLTSPVFPTARPISDAALRRQLDAMVGSGVENLRVVFNWSAAQPYPSWNDVPGADVDQYTDVDGIPTSFAQTDELMQLAAERGLTVLPVVLYAPSWDLAPHPAGTYGMPAHDGPYADYLRALVERYAPNGSFWATHSPQVPISYWQIWNEPNIDVFWPEQPFARSYVRLLRAAHAAAKSADPDVKIVLAGLPDFSWNALSQLYRAGARRLFDVVAVHPYTRSPKGVITILRRVRRVMDRAGDARKPIVADEISWPSALGRTAHRNISDFDTTQAGQASDLARLLPMLGRERVRLGLLGFDYYTWAGTDRRGGVSFDFAGLFRLARGRFVAKPAFSSFKRAALALEACRAKGALATDCLHS
jgi:hypothetical protein